MKIKLFIFLSYFIVFYTVANGQIVTVNQYEYIAKSRKEVTENLKEETKVNELKASDDNMKEPTRKPEPTVRRFYSPLKKLIPTSSYGLRLHPVTGKWKQHTGIDLKAYYEPVYTIADGVVKYAGRGNTEGLYVVVLHGNAETVYCHLSKLLCKKGDILKGGKVLGISGNTGRSTGPHLHLGVKYHSKRINPLALLKEIAL